MSDQQPSPSWLKPPPAGVQDPLSDRIDTTVPHPARRYDYWLGGKDNFAADRESGDAIAAAYPGIRIAVLENRRFLNRAVTFLVGEAGIRQFLDIGTGIPTANNTHEVAQSIAPQSRIVYVDNDPIVLTHARARLTSAPEGVTAYIDADLREPERILGDPDLARALDMSRPVALMLISILPFITDDHDPYGIVARLVDALAPGSYVAITHPTYDFLSRETIERLKQVSTPSQGPFRPRTRAEFARFLDGLDLVEPGIQPVAEWRPDGDPADRPSPAEVAVYGAIARKS